MNGDDLQQQAVPVIEEELVTGTRAVVTGSVRVRKEVERTEDTVEMPATRDVVSVNRVSINREVSIAPSVREEGDTLIISVVEEEIVIQKRLMLIEEIHIQRRQITEQVTKSIMLDHEHAIVERLDKEGKVVATSTPVIPEPKRRLTQRRRPQP